MKKLEGRVAIITGGGSGIGRAGSVLFAREGAKVVIAELNAAKGEAVAETIRREGGQAVCVQTDVSQTESVKATVARTEELFGGVDVLFTCAANVPLINTADAVVTDLKEEVFDEIHRVVARGTFLSAKYAGQAMIRRGGGAMVLTVTVDAQIGCPGLDAYTAAKGAVIAMTRSMAAGLAPHRIRVNAIAPGFVDTEPQQSFMADPQKRKGIESLHLLPVPKPEDIVPLALFLVSDESRFLTGGIYQADAGYLAFKCSHVDVMNVVGETKPDAK